jgi:hypothetical protein
MRFPATFIAAAALSLLLAAGCTAGGDVVCPVGMDPFTELNVYFGLEKSSGETVSEEEWQTFLAGSVTPRFPDGLTVLDARGQWLDTDEGRLYRESTRLLNVLVPADASDDGVSAVRDIADTYKERFEQQAVFYTTLPACAAVY